MDWEPTPVAEPDRLGRTDAARYGAAQTLGAGGMGRVEAVVDARLGREVARKTLHPELADQPAARARFLREVRITAHLDHPGVVPIFDAGQDADGNPWYTMRLVRGRSFEELIATSGLPARLALVPRFLAACEAVAYAHAHAIVHRDLKPSNLMAGAFGETQVVDWGLARELDASVDDLGPMPTVEGGTRVGAVLGTPGWMSPEQARGEPADRASDVYALGRVLHALLSGRCPPDGSKPADVPEDLFAVALRATAEHPADRYPDAAALAADVAAWLAGERVSTYAYPARELARRLLVAWRAPLAVGAVATVAVVGAIAVGWADAAVERDRAVQAETAMRDVLRADLVGEGVAALGAHRLGVAAQAAADALTLGDDPAVRGLVAALEAHAPTPRLLSDVASPACLGVALDPDGQSLVCVDTGTLSLWPVDGGPAVWSVPSDASDAARPTAGGPVYAGGLLAITTHDAASGATLHAVRPGHGRGLVRAGPGPAVVDSLRLWLPDGRPVTCGEQVQVYSAAWLDGDWLLACTDERLLRVGETVRSIPLDGDAAIGIVSVAALDAGSALVGTIAGTVLRVDLATGTTLARSPPGEGPVRRIVPSPDGRLAAVAGERGAVRILGLDGMTWLAGLPEMARELAWRSDRTLVTAGERLRVWALDGEPTWGTLRSEAGLDGVAIGEGGLVTLHDGSGHVTAHRTDGARVAHLHWQGGVVKEGEHADGRFFAVSVHGHGVQRWDATTWQALPPIGTAAFRDVAPLAGGAVVAAPWGAGVVWFDPDGSPRTLRPSLSVAQVVAERAGSRWLMVADPSGLVLFEGEVERWSAPDLRARGTLSGDGRVVWAITDAALLRLDAHDGSELGRFPVSGVGASAIGTSQDGGLVAVGALDGTTRVWTADGVLRGVLAGHAERVSDVRFGEGWLVTSGWDGLARRWATAPLTEPTEALRARLGTRTAP